VRLSCFNIPTIASSMQMRFGLKLQLHHQSVLVGRHLDNCLLTALAGLQ
jgi:hypothetical protein